MTWSVNTMPPAQRPNFKFEELDEYPLLAKPVDH
jgi:hypothetical protein